MKDDPNVKVAADYFKQALREGLTPCVGTRDVEAVKNAIKEQLTQLRDRGIITNQPSPPPRVTQLWRKWSLGQKAKWYFYNRFPLLRGSSEAIRKAIDGYNETAYQLNELFLVHKDPDDYVPYKQYPEHLIPNPKLIYVTDVYLHPSCSVEYVTVDITVDPEKI